MTNTPQPSILIVDDRPENLLAMKGALEGMGYTIVTATSGQEALKLSLKQRFDLALLDVQMPNMDGFELAKLLRGKKETRDMQIIFITAISKEQKYIEHGYEVGAINYLFKPIDPDELRNKVNVALKWSKYHKTIETLNARKVSATDESMPQQPEENA
jgi:two-component system, cell cycle response regulator